MQHCNKRRQIQYTNTAPTQGWQLTVGLLVAGTSTWTTKLLGLAAARIGNQEGAIVVDQHRADLLLGGLIHKLLVVGNHGLGNSLTDS